jgi:hypothetical protein
VHAAHGVGAGLDVAPARRIEGVGVHVEALVLGDRLRQGRQHRQLRFVQRGARPVDDEAGIRMHRRRRSLHDGGVVVAEHGDGTLGQVVAQAVDDPAGIGTVADEIAEEHVALAAAFA